jgi:hypothetical protein
MAAIRTIAAPSQVAIVRILTFPHEAPRIPARRKPPGLVDRSYLTTRSRVLASATHRCIARRNRTRAPSTQ